MKWEWKGRPLAHPLTILRRLAVLPFYKIAAMACVFLAYLGWGKADAERVRSDLQ